MMRKSVAHNTRKVVQIAVAFFFEGLLTFRNLAFTYVFYLLPMCCCLVYM